MTVYENISFGLTNVKEALPKIDFDARISARLSEILSEVDLLLGELAHLGEGLAVPADGVVVIEGETLGGELIAGGLPGNAVRAAASARGNRLHLRLRHP